MNDKFAGNYGIFYPMFLEVNSDGVSVFLIDPSKETATQAIFRYSRYCRVAIPL